MWLKLGLVASVLLVICEGQLAPRPKVNIPGLGMVHGVSGWESTIKRNRIHSYRGIPFGLPPVGSKRFKPSEAWGPWKGIHSGRSYGRICAQTGNFKRENTVPGFWDHVYALGENITENGEDISPRLRDLEPRTSWAKEGEGSVEDCLNLQIFVPEHATGNLPVMVFYHGGAFLDGSSLIYWPQNLLDHDLVLVVPHYRLGPLGFLSLENDAMPGNAGLFDQVLALEWVNQHIHHFKGNKNQVTIFGESAGAASVSILSVSPLLKGRGLFHRLIAQSGSAITEWAIDREPVRNTMGIAEAAGCPVDQGEQAVIDCLYNIDALELIMAYKYNWKDQEMKRGNTGFGGCSPVVQKNTGTAVLLDKMPIEYWRDPDFETVPGMYGANKHEGTYVMAIVYHGYLRANDLLEDMDFIKHNAISVFLNIFYVNDPGYLIHDALEYEYVGIDRMGNLTAMIPGMIDFSGDTFLKGSSFENMKLHAKFGPSYWYAFNFFDRATLWPFVGSFDVPFGGGVTHANDLIFLFNIPVISDTLTPAEKEKSREMSHIWANYGIYGEVQPEGKEVPGVPEWPPYTPEVDPYVRFDWKNLALKDFTQEYTIAVDEDFSLK